MREFVKRAFVSFAIANAALNVVMFLLVVLPRERTRHVRHTLARVVMRLWVLLARVGSMLHEDLWQKGNGYE